MMGAEEKIRAKAEEAAGAAKKKIGEQTGDRDLQAEGQAEEVKGKVRETSEDLKQKAKDAADRARERFGKG
jgi:uncharacterized protein YjbJ (UPF0337 family)